MEDFNKIETTLKKMSVPRLLGIFYRWDMAWHGNSGIIPEIEFKNGKLSFFDKFAGIRQEMTVPEFRNWLIGWFASFVVDRAINENGELSHEIARDEIIFIMDVL